MLRGFMVMGSRSAIFTFLNTIEPWVYVDDMKISGFNSRLPSHLVHCRAYSVLPW